MEQKRPGSTFYARCLQASTIDWRLGIPLIGRLIDSLGLVYLRGHREQDGGKDVPVNRTLGMPQREARTHPLMDEEIPASEWWPEQYPHLSGGRSNTRICWKVAEWGESDRDLMYSFLY